MPVSDYCQRKRLPLRKFYDPTISSGEECSLYKNLLANEESLCYPPRKGNDGEKDILTQHGRKSSYCQRCCGW